MKSYDKWIKKNISQLNDKNVFVLGASGSLGEETCRYLAQLDANVYIVVRNEKKGLALKEKLEKEFPNNSFFIKLLDLSNLQSVYEFVDNIKDIKIDYFISTAGVYHLERVNTKEGLEIHYATNYYNQIKLIECLVDRIKNNNGKIVVLGSISYRFGEINFNDVMGLKIKNQTLMYGMTKRLFIIHLLYMIKKGAPIAIAHPGVSATGLFSPKKGKFNYFFSKIIYPLMKVVFMSPKKSALNIMYALNKNIPYSYQVGPRGLFRIWGYPCVYKFHKSVLKEELQSKVIESYENILK